MPPGFESGWSSENLTAFNLIYFLVKVDYFTTITELGTIMVPVTKVADVSLRVNIIITTIDFSNSN